jgi:hypothetical protein
MVSTDRGQAITLEALLAGFILLTTVSLVFGVLVVNEDTLGPDSKNYEQTRTAEKVYSTISATVRTEEVQQTILYWNQTNNSFYNTSTESYYTDRHPPTSFGEALNETVPKNYTANTKLIYREDIDNDGTFEQKTQRLSYNGEPKPSSFSVYYTFALHDTQKPTSKNMSVSDDTLSDSSFYAPDISSDVYNIITIEVIVWET